MASVVSQPDLIPQPWATGGSHATIPETSSDFGRASWSQGFPAETALPLNAGGIPPNYLDFQGVLYALSQHTIFGQAGGRYAWNNSTNYPLGACIIGSNGTVYQALQESGPGTSAGAKNPTSSGNSAYWGALATPDGSTIKLSGGKLSVDLSNIADGTTIVVQNNKLTAVGGGGGDASSLADNQTIIASSDKLVVNLANAPVTKLKNINNYLITSGGGLLVDSTTGKLSVDFPTLHLLSWIGDAGIGTQFYVDGANGNDSTGDGSQSSPWKTIAHATESLCKNYNINSRTVYINIAAGTYTEQIALTEQQRTTGEIVLRPVSGATVNVEYSAAGSQRIFTHSGGKWRLQNMNITLNLQEINSGNHYPGAVYSSAGELYIETCNFAFTDTSTSTVNARMIWSTGGKIHLQSLSGNSTVTWSGTITNATLDWIHAENGGEILAHRAATSNQFNVSGEFTVFCSIGMNSYYKITGSAANNPVWNPVNSPTGKRYAAYFGGAIATEASSGTAVKTYFPGNTAGTVEASTYSWILPVPT